MRKLRQAPIDLFYLSGLNIGGGHSTVGSLIV